MKRAIAIVVITLLVPSPSAFAGERRAETRHREPGKHKWLGMTTGLVTGFLLGGYAAGRIASDSQNVGTFFTLWTAFAVGGAGAGYALAGGFKDDLDVALDDGRAAVREALTRRDEEASRGGAAPLPELRLSSIRGFDINTAPHSEPGARIALAR